MTLAEFKAWFEGYTEGLEAAPTKAQFDRIKEKVKEIDGTVTTYPVYVERYRPPQWVPYWTNPVWAGGTTGVNPYPTYSTNGFQTSLTFDSTFAMYALGKSDAAIN